MQKTAEKDEAIKLAKLLTKNSPKSSEEDGAEGQRESSDEQQCGENIYDLPELVCLKILR